MRQPLQPRLRPSPFRRRLRADPSFWLELQLCDDWHIPHSEFLEFGEDDRAKAIAFRLEKAEKCVMCGTAPWEYDPAQGGHRHAYEPVEHVCPGCRLKALAQDDSPDRDTKGITVELLPARGQAAAQRHVHRIKREREAAADRALARRERGDRARARREKHR